MKFSDGLWLNQRGFDVSYAVQAYDVTTTKNSIKIFATSSAIWNRAMTLGGVALKHILCSYACNRLNFLILNAEPIIPESLRR